MRLFIAASPPAAVLDALGALARPAHPRVRWTEPDQWHVTLRFLGEVPEPALDGLVAAFRSLAAHPPVQVALGPAARRLSRHVLALPVDGLDQLHDAVVLATAAYGEPLDDRPYAGHLTLARGRRNRPLPANTGGQELAASWWVRELLLIRSTPTDGGHRYETLATVSLAGGPAGPADAR